MTNATTNETVYEGRFLRVARRGGWEYATRAKATGVVAVIALHDDGRIVLVEQHRPPVNHRVVELPAGLAGDMDASEPLLEAAKRELEEETGYTAQQWKRLSTASSSPGLTDEAITFFLAQGLTKSAEGGGVGAESITIHEVSLDGLPRWLESIQETDTKVDMKLLAGVFLAAAATKPSTP